MKEISLPAYRADQIFSWLYKKRVSDFSEMVNLGDEAIGKLEKEYIMDTLSISEVLESFDGTKKFVFKLSDDNAVETVLICSKKRRTVCVSTQVGCKFKCVFCASGLRGFKRNLTTGEIVSQVLKLEQETNERVTNIVFMGMGEPFDNYENLVRSIKILNCKKGIDIGARKMTVSTCGIVPGIKAFGELGLQVNLSISLHAANNKKRDLLMPVNREYPLGELVEVCEEYMKSGGRKITLEYVLIDKLNNDLIDANELSDIARRLYAKINLIPYSEISSLKYSGPSKDNVHNFASILEDNGISVTIRDSRGSDIQAACGQLLGE